MVSFSPLFDITEIIRKNVFRSKTQMMGHLESSHPVKYENNAFVTWSPTFVNRTVILAMPIFRTALVE